MANKAKFAFGQSSGIEAAIADKKIDAFDLLMLDGNTDSPKMGWLDAQGNPVIIDHKADIAEMEVQIDEKLATKVSAEEVDSKIELALDGIEEMVTKAVEDATAIEVIEF